MFFCYTFALAFKKCRPAASFLAYSFFEKIYIYREVVQEASAASFDVGRWVKETSYHFS